MIIPTYNRAATIMRSIASVLNQTYPCHECIVVDDCSTDETERLVRGFDDPRVIYVKLSKNHGAPYARNYGASMATGDYLAFQDSDDEWRDGKLEMQVRSLRLSGCEACVCRFERHAYERGTQPIIPSPSIKDGPIEYEDILRGGVVSTQTIVVNRALFLNYKFDTGLGRLQDYEWSIRFGASHTICLVGDVLVDVYLQPDSITVVSADRRIDFYEAVLSNDLEICKSYPWFHSKVLSEYAKCKMEKGDRAWHLYLYALRTYPSFKGVCKFLLSLFGVAA